MVVSVEGPAHAQQTQADFPHLVVVADAQRGLSTVATVLHPQSGHDGGDTAVPATLLVDRHGTVRWTNRPERYLTRLAPAELLAAIDQHLSGKR